MDSDSSEHPIRLHFAIIAYKKSVIESNEEVYKKLASLIYKTFLRPEHGLCNFIDSTIREQICRRIDSGNSTNPLKLFDGCAKPLERFLRAQHALFVKSAEFLNFYNATTPARRKHDELPSTSTATTSEPQQQQRRIRKWEKTRVKAVANPEEFEATTTPHSAMKLTADMLLRSQKARETTLGRRFVKNIFLKFI